MKKYPEQKISQVQLQELLYANIPARYNFKEKNSNSTLLRLITEEVLDIRAEAGKFIEINNKGGLNRGDV